MPATHSQPPRDSEDEPITIALRNVDPSPSRVLVHAVVHEGDEFVGDFGVTFDWDDRHNQYVNDDYEGFRHCGGLYVDHKPGSKIMRDVADAAEQYVPFDVTQRFR